jgi:glycosyltransferase involved in cell wall biosynthesis
MIRVLHLFGPAADFQSHYTSALLARHAPARIQITARTMDVGRRDRSALNTYLYLRKCRGAFDVVHAWDITALTMAVLARGPWPILFSPSSVGLAQVKRLRRLMGFADVRTICSASLHHRYFVRHGIAPERCQIISPALEHSISVSQPDQELRQQLRFAPDEIVLLAPGVSTRDSRHREALWAVSILHVFDPRYRLLVWGRGPQTRALETLSARLRQPRMLVVAERRLGRTIEFAALASVADLVLATGAATSSPLPLATCMTAGKAIVGSADGICSEFLEDGRTAAMVSAAKPRLLAQRVLELCSDHSLRITIASGAVNAARARFDLRTFVDRYSTIYAEMATAGQRCRTTEKLASRESSLATTWTPS